MSSHNNKNDEKRESPTVRLLVSHEFNFKAASRHVCQCCALRHNFSRNKQYCQLNRSYYEVMYIKNIYLKIGTIVAL